MYFGRGVCLFFGDAISGSIFDIAVVYIRKRVIYLRLEQTRGWAQFHRMCMLFLFDRWRLFWSSLWSGLWLHLSSISFIGCIWVILRIDTRITWLWEFDTVSSTHLMLYKVYIVPVLFEVIWWSADALTNLKYNTCF